MYAATLANKGSLTITGSVFTNNLSNAGGEAIGDTCTSCTITGCTISGNTESGIWATGALNLYSCTIEDNYGGNGGGVDELGGYLLMKNCLVEGNTGTGGGLSISSSLIENSIIADCQRAHKTGH